MAGLGGLDEMQKATVRDEIMFLDLAVFANLMGTERVKQHWPKGEAILFEYLAALKESLEMGGGNFDGLLESWEAREKPYRDVLMKPLVLLGHKILPCLRLAPAPAICKLEWA
jgi:hypothetical protein